MRRTSPPRLWSRAADFVSLFATPLRVSHYAELLNPLWASHSLRARVVKVWDETPDCRTLTLAPGRGFRTHRAGQHIRVGVAIGGQWFTRTYSISSSPDAEDGHITLTVKTKEDGWVSRHLVRKTLVGDHLSIGLAQGDFVVPDAMPVSPLFITAGSGITPVMSILRTYVARGTLPETRHIHYAPDARQTIFGAELQSLAEKHSRYHLRSVFTQVKSEGGVTPEHFSAPQLDGLCPDWRSRDAWVCGPRSLIDSVEAHYAAADLSHRLHVERFSAPLADLPEGATGGSVLFTSSGKQATADAATPLLQVAEQAGLNPPHGCRMGICHTCDARLVSGCVRDLRTGELLDEPGQTVQVCICAAAGDVALEL